MRLRTVRIAFSMIALPDVFAVMSRPSRIGTPEQISVDSVRQNRATATFLKMTPSSGSRSSIAVHAQAAGLRRVVPPEHVTRRRRRRRP